MNETLTQPRIKYKSYIYNTQLKWLGNRSGVVTSEGKPEFRVASPPEFKGENGVWTPEDLFVASVETCTMTTFVAYALKKNLPVLSYTSFAEGVMENSGDGFKFKHITLKPVVVVEDEAFIQEAQKILNDAHRDCFIANSIRAEVTMESSIVVAEKGI